VSEFDKESLIYATRAWQLVRGAVDRASGVRGYRGGSFQITEGTTPLHLARLSQLPGRNRGADSRTHHLV